MKIIKLDTIRNKITWRYYIVLKCNILLCYKALKILYIIIIYKIKQMY